MIPFVSKALINSTFAFSFCEYKSIGKTGISLHFSAIRKCVGLSIQMLVYTSMNREEQSHIMLKIYMDCSYYYTREHKIYNIWSCDKADTEDRKQT